MTRLARKNHVNVAATSYLLLGVVVGDGVAAGAGVRFQVSILFFQTLPRSVPRAPTRARHDQGAGTRGRRQWRRKVTTFAAV